MGMKKLVFLLALGNGQGVIWLPDNTIDYMYKGLTTSLCRRVYKAADDQFYAEYWKAVAKTDNVYGDIDLVQIKQFFSKMLELTLNDKSKMQKRLKSNLEKFIEELEWTRFDRTMNIRIFKKIVTHLHVAHALSLMEHFNSNGDDYVDSGERKHIPESWRNVKIEANTDGLTKVMEKVSTPVEIVWSNFGLWANDVFDLNRRNLDEEPFPDELAIGLAAKTLKMIPVLHILLTDRSSGRQRVEKLCPTCFE